ncbi:MAG: hypothetical protein AAF577_00620 [Pseudomonadota bacterium]
MNRIVFLSSVVVILGFAAVAYGINYRTTETLRDIDRLRMQIADARETVQVLHVEWAHLNRPDRLAALVERHGDVLGLAPLGPDHFGAVEAVPYPPRADDDPIAAALAAASTSILAQHGRREAPLADPDPGLLPLLSAEAATPRRAALRLDLPAHSMRREADDTGDFSDATALLGGVVAHGDFRTGDDLVAAPGERVDLAQVSTGLRPRPGDGPPPRLLDGERGAGAPRALAPLPGRADGAETEAEIPAAAPQETTAVLPPRRPGAVDATSPDSAASSGAAWPEKASNGVRLPPVRPGRSSSVDQGGRRVVRAPFDSAVIAAIPDPGPQLTGTLVPRATTAAAHTVAEAAGQGAGEGAGRASGGAE